MNEKEFLESTPKKLFKLAAIHQDINTPKDSSQKQTEEVKEVYIDNLIL